MKIFPNKGTSWGGRVAKWIKDNANLEHYILSELKRKGPLSSREFEDRSERQWISSGWTNNRNVTRMLEFLFFQGKMMVAGEGKREALGSSRKVPSKYRISFYGNVMLLFLNCSSD